MEDLTRRPRPASAPDPPRVSATPSAPDEPAPVVADADTPSRTLPLLGPDRDVADPGFPIGPARESEDPAGDAGSVAPIRRPGTGQVRIRDAGGRDRRDRETRRGEARVRDTTDRDRRRMAGRPDRAGTTRSRVGPAGIRGFGWRGAVVGLASLVTIGSIIWALGLRTQLDDRQADLVALRALSTAASLRDNATAWTLTATAEGPAGAIGNVFYSEREQRLALAATGLPALPAGESYRLWFVDGGTPPGSARLAGTFQTAADGTAALVMPNVPPGSVVGVAVTAAPDVETSSTPTTPFLLVGSVSAAG